MADNTNTTDTGNIPKMEDTKTRKTLKLKPVVNNTEKDVAEPIVDPLTIRNTETGPLATMEDTRTRKTVKLKATKTGIITLENIPQAELKTVVDPLTMRNTETGPLGAMVDTRTRKTVKLKPLKTASGGASTAGEIPSPEPAVAEKAPEPQTLQDTNTRKTLKLKAVKPGEAPAEPKADGSLQDTNTRKTLKLKAVKPGEAPAAAKKENIPSKKTTGVALQPEEDAAESDTIKIERPKKKADAMPMPSLGVTVAAKTVNNKETVKLRPSATGATENAPAGDEATVKASKATIKLTPPATPGETESAEEKKDDTPAPAAEETPKKSKLTIGKAPPPKSAPKETEEPEAPAGKAGGLKLKSMAPKIEAPRATADQAKIKEKKTKKKGNNEASVFYTMVAVISFILVAFSALVTVSQFYELWDKENPVGQQIVPHVKGIMTDVMKSLK